MEDKTQRHKASGSFPFYCRYSPHLCAIVTRFVLDYAPHWKQR
jgi:hypothetical protein